MSFSTKSVLKAAVAVAILAALAACASKPTETAVVTQPQLPPPPAVTPPPPPVERPLPPAPPAIAPGSQQEFVVNIGDRVYFDLDMSSIRSDAMATLDAQAAWLNRYPAVKVRIEGNADERGTREYNFALGARRAEAVQQYLISRGVLPSRISTISYGKENPIDPRSTEEAWAKNRNGHTAIVGGAN